MLRIFSALVGATFVTACGGGGSSGSGDTRIVELDHQSVIVENTTHGINFSPSFPFDDAEFTICGGEDSDLFTVSATDYIRLSFNPDFENPADSNQDNIYSAIACVSVGGKLKGRINIDFQVENENNQSARIIFPPRNANIGDNRSPFPLSGIGYDFEDGITDSRLASISSGSTDGLVDGSPPYSWTIDDIRFDPGPSMTRVEGEYDDGSTFVQDLAVKSHATFLSPVRAISTDFGQLIQDAVLPGFVLRKNEYDISRVVLPSYPDDYPDGKPPYAYNESDSEIIVVGKAEGIYATSLVTNTYRVVTIDTSNVEAAALAIDDLFDTLLILDSSEPGNARILVANLDTPQITTLSYGSEDNPGSNIGSGPPLSGVHSMTLHQDSRILYAISDTTIYSIDLRDGNRTEHSGVNRGSGHQLTDALHIHQDFPTLGLVVADGNGQIFSVDRLSGDRTVIYDVQTDQGSLESCCGPVLVTGQTSLDVYDPDAPVIHRIETYSRMSYISTDGNTGEAAEEIIPAQLAYEPSTATLYSLDKVNQRINSTLVSEGVTTVLTRRDTVSVPAFTGLIDLDLDQDNNRLLVLADNSDSAETLVFAVDLDSGERSLISSSLQGDVSDLSHAKSIDTSHDGSFLVVFTRSGTTSRIIRVDTETGQRTTVIESDQSMGGLLGDTVDIQINNLGTSAYVLDSISGDLVRIDLNTGLASLDSANDAGNGTMLASPGSTSFTANGAGLLVLDDNLRLVRIDLTSGQRTLELDNVLSSPGLRAPEGAQLYMTAGDNYLFASSPESRSIFMRDQRYGDAVNILQKY